MKKIIRNSILSFAAGLALMLGGCAAPKNVTYFQEFENLSVQDVAQNVQFRVRPDDKLSIIVYTKDDQLDRLFNLGMVSTRNTQFSAQSGTSARFKAFAGSAESYSSYTVSKSGTIDFPVLGVIKIEGMTREEVAAFIKGELEARNLVADPVVIVEFLNFGVNVLGEVRVPARYDINSNDITLLDALTLAGDLNITADRENVMVLREENGKMEVYTVDLTKGKDLLKSPVYYLRQGDTVYVGPNSMRKRSTTVNGNQALSASFWVSVASLLTSVAVLVFK